MYAELSIEDLKQEYSKTKTELADFRIMIEKGMITSQDMMSVTSFIKKQEWKLRAIKELLQLKLKQGGLAAPPSNDTMDTFDFLFNKKKNDASHRLKALYSYDIKDNPNFQRAQKIEKRIRKFYGM